MPKEEMEIILQSRRNVTALGERGLGVFCKKELTSIGMKPGDQVLVIAFKRGKERGILIKK